MSIGPPTFKNTYLGMQLLLWAPELENPVGILRAK